MAETKKTTTIDADTNVIKVVRCTKRNETDPVATRCDWTFDLSEATHAEILELAARTLVIDAQRLWRKGDIADSGNYSLATLKADRRTPADPKAFLAAMNPEARRKWLEDNGMI